MKKFKKRVLLFLISLFIVFNGITVLSSCDSAVISDALNTTIALENENLKLENAQLKSKLEKIQWEYSTFKFNSLYPEGLITESCTLSNISIVKDVIDPQTVNSILKVEGEGVEVTINNGYYSINKNSFCNISLWANDNSHVIVNSGTFKINNIDNTITNHCVYASENSIIEIKGGFFVSSGNSNNLIYYQNDGSSIIVTGGTFVNFNPSKFNYEGEYISLLAQGYEIYSETIDNIAYYTVVKSI